MAKDPAQAKPATENNSLSLGYMPGIDALRFISAAGVIFHHSAQQLYEKGFIKNPMASQVLSGAFFLNVFFIISGFLICSILMKEIASGKYSVKNFFIRRILRIWPLYFLTVVLFIIVIPLLRKGGAGDLGANVLYASLFSINFQLMVDGAAKTYSVLWSVCIEEQLYLLLPLLLLLFARNFKVLSIAMLVVGFGSWVYFSRQHAAGGASPYYNTLSYFYFFGAGMLLAAFREKLISVTNKLFSPGTQLAVLIVGFFYVYSKFPPACYVMPIWLGLSALLGVYLVLAASQSSFLLSPPNGIARFLGNISYGMYLVHIFIISLSLNFFFSKGSLLGGPVAFLLIPLLVTTLSAALAALLYYVYERHFLKLKGRFTKITNK